jgi:hypothetical protein
MLYCINVHSSQIPRLDKIMPSTCEILSSRTLWQHLSISKAVTQGLSLPEEGSARSLITTTEHAGGSPCLRLR